MLVSGTEETSMEGGPPGTSVTETVHFVPLPQTVQVNMKVNAVAGVTAKAATILARIVLLILVLLEIR